MGDYYSYRTTLFTETRTFSAVCASRPETTSSSTRRCGRLSDAPAVGTRCLCPSESCLAFLSRGEAYGRQPRRFFHPISAVAFLEVDVFVDRGVRICSRRCLRTQPSSAPPRRQQPSLSPATAGDGAELDASTRSKEFCLRRFGPMFVAVSLLRGVASTLWLGDTRAGSRQRRGV